MRHDPVCNSEHCDMCSMSKEIQQRRAQAIRDTNLLADYQQRVSDATQAAQIHMDLARDYKERLKEERAKLDAANKEIERLKVWSSDSHVTQLESKLEAALADAQSWKESESACCTQYDKLAAESRALQTKLECAVEALSWIEGYILVGSNGVCPSSQELYDDRFNRIMRARDALAKIGKNVHLSEGICPACSSKEGDAVACKLRSPDTRMLDSHQKEIGYHDGCSYIAAGFCNKCGWLGQKRSTKVDPEKGECS